ncbi:energy transducer TonB [Candidatus Thiodictyon syntrophicum]|jgi:protein TonB|uniref:TonB C-terminal domain-containing protein n=1 Tax=Candidatus Thiodictyon syntrophicum TaxID=1166950 RepID=A0A2K8U6Q3_9GAMM|nr:energy transducer TonB [Candidatus Thiodictyon syntrophicum]AUB81270.1 hypothetical protein THSYN_10100 [Candidatus Thiodictyon syntrophicum]
MEHTPIETSHTQGLPRALTAPLDGGPSRILPAALLGAAVLHLFLILAISFKLPQPRNAPPDQSLEIVLLKDPGQATRNPEPDAALSQRSRVGESPRGDGVIASPLDGPPLPALTPAEDEPLPDEPRAQDPRAQPAVATAAPPAARTPPRPRPERVVAAPTPQPRPAPKVPEPPPPRPPPAAQAARPVDAARILQSRDQEIARLTESLQARSAAYASRQRRKSISASTREFRYASYLGAWARKVERIGNINYPQAAKDQHLYGNLILSVAVRADGTVEQVRVVRSSGYPLLDQAAIQIVQLAAPYSAFPPDIAAETDVLDIVRTWQFLRGGKLAWE